MIIPIAPELHGKITNNLMIHPFQINYNIPVSFFNKHRFYQILPLLQTGHLLPPTCQGSLEAITKAYLSFTLVPHAAIKQDIGINTIFLKEDIFFPIN